MTDLHERDGSAWWVLVWLRYRSLSWEEPRAVRGLREARELRTVHGNGVYEVHAVHGVHEVYAPIDQPDEERAKSEPNQAA